MDGLTRLELHNIYDILQSQHLTSEKLKSWMRLMMYLLALRNIFNSVPKTYIRSSRTIPLLVDCVYDPKYLGGSYNYSYPERMPPSLSSQEYCRVHLDAPLALFLRLNWTELVYNDDAGIRYVAFPGIISIMSFFPDIDNKILYIYQMQGGDTSYFTKKSNINCVKCVKRARPKFKFALPELFTYDLLEHVARANDMKYIAIRRPEFNIWPEVRKRAGNTLYDSVAYHKGFVCATEHANITNGLDKVNAEVYFWKSL